MTGITYFPSQDAQRWSNKLPVDGAFRIAVLEAILTAVGSGLFTATVVVSSYTQSDRLINLYELKELGYAVDGTTTPGSWIISWL